MYSHVNSQGRTFYLNKLNVFMRQGTQSVIYFFSLDQRESGIAEIPEGWYIVESPNTKLPLLKKRR